MKSVDAVGKRSIVTGRSAKWGRSQRETLM